MKLTKKEEGQLKEKIDPILDKMYGNGAHYVIKRLRDMISKSLSEGYVGVGYVGLLENLSEIEESIRRIQKWPKQKKKEMNI